jgi:hypothetical protein
MGTAMVRNDLPDQVGIGVCDSLDIPYNKRRGRGESEEVLSPLKDGQ